MTTLVWHKEFFSHWAECIEFVVLVFVFRHVCTLSCYGLTSFKKSFVNYEVYAAYTVLRTNSNLRAFWNRASSIISSLSRLRTHSSLCYKNALRNSETLKFTLKFPTQRGSLAIRAQQVLTVLIRHHSIVSLYVILSTFCLLSALWFQTTQFNLVWPPEKVRREHGLCARFEECIFTDSRRCTTI